MLLFVADNRPNSYRAKDNLKKICDQRLRNEYELEVIDVLEDSGKALEYNILVIPAVVLETPHRATILGDLSDPSAVLRALGLTVD